MIKTINTRVVTDIMLEAQNVIDRTTTYSDPLSFKDAADIFIAMAEAAPAVEPAILNTCLSNAKQESEVNDIMNNKLSEYGEFVREMRQSRGLYLKQMADFIGIGSAHMSGIEFGRYELTKEILQKTFEFFTQTPVVKPAQAVPVGYCLMPREPTQWMREQIACGIESNSVADVWGRLIRAVDIENKHRAKEPAQAVPFAWVLECMTSIGTTCWMLSWNRSGVGSCNRLHGQDHEKPLYTAPPAIDDETKRMVLELCRLIIDKAGPDSMITRAMAQKAEKISERLEAGE